MGGLGGRRDGRAVCEVWVGLRNGGDGCKGGVWVSLSLEAKNKREKFASSFTSPDFFFKKFYVMKCLRSKKRLNASDYTTHGTPRV